MHGHSVVIGIVLSQYSAGGEISSLIVITGFSSQVVQIQWKTLPIETSATLDERPRARPCHQFVPFRKVHNLCRKGDISYLVGKAFFSRAGRDRYSMRSAANLSSISRTVGGGS
jgi:hypothetical protein